MEKKEKTFIIKSVAGDTFQLHRSPDILVKIFTRPLGLLLTKLIVKTPIQPNHLSAASLLLALFAAALIVSSEYKSGIIAGILLLVVLVFDVADGTLARYRNKLTKFGEYWEYLNHEIVPPLLLFALGINSYKYYDNVIPLYLGGFVVLLLFFINISRSSKERIVLENVMVTRNVPEYVHDTIMKETKRSFLSVLVSTVMNLFNSPAYFFPIILVLAIINKLHYLIFFYTLFYFVIALGKGYIELRQGFKPYGLE